MAATAASDPMRDRLLGGRWQVGELLGAGGMGRVYLASGIALDRRVVVKVLRPELSASADAAERFRDEARLASSLRHPNIVAVIDAGQTDDGLLYLVMELVAGRSLADLVQRDGALPIGRAVALTRQLLSAITALHQVGVVHGDIKSDNAMVSPTRQGGGRLKLIDFGLALRMSVLDPSPAARAGDLQVRGTPEYMAPELIRGTPASTASDVYAAGVMLYELLTGHLPFTESTPLRTMARHLSGGAQPPSRRRPDGAIPAALDAVVARAMAKRPADRFAGSQELSDVLAAIAPRRRDAPDTCRATSGVTSMASLGGGARWSLAEQTPTRLDPSDRSPRAVARVPSLTSGRWRPPWPMPARWSHRP